MILYTCWRITHYTKFYSLRLHCTSILSTKVIHNILPIIVHILRKTFSIITQKQKQNNRRFPFHVGFIWIRRKLKSFLQSSHLNESVVVDFTKNFLNYVIVSVTVTVIIICQVKACLLCLSPSCKIYCCFMSCESTLLSNEFKIQNKLSPVFHCFCHRFVLIASSSSCLDV